MIRHDADIATTRYTGTDLTGTLNLPVDKNPKRVAKTVKREFAKRYDQTWFPTYGFADTYAFMVTKAFAKQHNLTTISDMGKVANTMTPGSIARG